MSSTTTTINYGTIKPSTSRSDDRLSNQLRPIDIIYHTLSRSSGSVDYIQGNTRLVVSIHNPALIQKQHDALYDRAIIQCKLFYSNQSTLTNTDIMYINIIESIFKHIISTHNYPRTRIVISIQVLHNDGSLPSSIINGIMCALLDSGLLLNCVASSCTLSIPHIPDSDKINNNNSNTDKTDNNTTTQLVWLDPSLIEQNTADLNAIYTYATTHTGELTQLYCNTIGNKMNVQQLFELNKIATLTCRRIINYISTSHSKRLDTTVNK